MASLLRQVYALLFCWLALSSQPFSMALNTRLTLSTSGKRSLRSVAANRLEARSEKFAEALSGWHMGMLEASVCRENCRSLFESAKSQGVAFFEEAKLIDRITPSFVQATLSVVSSSLSRTGMDVPKTLKESFDSIFEHGYSYPPLAPVFEKQLHHVLKKFEASETYTKAAETSSSEMHRVHKLLQQLLSRIALLDEQKELSEEIEKPLKESPEDGTDTPKEREPEEEGEEEGEEDIQTAEKSNKKHKHHTSVLHADSHILLQLETKTGVFLSFLLDIFLFFLELYIDNFVPITVYGLVGVVFVSLLLECSNGAAEPVRVVPPVQAELVVEAEEEEEAEDEATKDAPRCVVCWEKPIDVYSPTCRHYAMCRTCAEQLTHCPVCRAPLDAMEDMSWPKYKLIQSLFVNGKDN